jgi:UbiD family decarboxylase
MTGKQSGAAEIADLGAIIDWLDRKGRLVRVRSEVDPAHQLAGIAAKFERGPRAVLFEKVKGSRYPVFTGLYWSRELLGDLFGRPAATLPQHVAECIRDWQQQPMPPVVVETGPVLQVTEPQVDLSVLPVPTHAELDAGPYFDAGVVITKDPETGIRNTSIQRFLVVAKDRLAINIDAGRHLETVPRQGGRAQRAAALHAQRRRRPRPAFRRGDPGRGGADGYRRTRHRQPLPRPAAGTGCRQFL